MITFLSKKHQVIKTDSVFQRYNLVTEKEIKDMKWLGENVQRDVNLVTKLVTKEGFEKFEKVENKPEAGSPSRTRTSDPMINSHLLYQLSYWGTLIALLLKEIKLIFSDLQDYFVKNLRIFFNK